MSTTITRIYDSYGNALRAVNALKKIGYGAACVTLFSDATNSGETAHSSADGGNGELVAAIGGWGITSGDAKDLAGYLGQGKSLVIAKAELGAAVRAMSILDRNGPNAEKLGANSYYQSSALPDDADRTWSEALGLPTLSADATPFSTFWYLPTLISSGAGLSKWLNWTEVLSWEKRPRFTFGVPKLFNSPAPLSAAYNIPTLWNPVRAKAVSVARKTYSIAKDAAPLSAFFGLATTWRPSAASAAIFNLPTLTRSAPIMSEKFNFPTLLGGKDGAAAYLFGAPKLIQSAAWLSSSLGIPVLWRSPDDKP